MTGDVQVEPATVKPAAQIIGRTLQRFGVLVSKRLHNLRSQFVHRAGIFGVLIHRHHVARCRAVTDVVVQGEATLASFVHQFRCDLKGGVESHLTGVLHQDAVRLFRIPVREQDVASRCRCYARMAS